MSNFHGRSWLGFLLLTFVAGCGAQNAAPPTAKKSTPATTTANKVPVADADSAAAATDSPLAETPVADEGAPAAAANNATPRPLSAEETASLEGPPDARPATAADAAKLLDLATFPLAPDAAENAARSLASQRYTAAGKSRDVYKFIEDKLLSQNWLALPTNTVTDEYASGVFARQGYRLSVSVFGGGKPDEVRVNLHNHGNVNLAKVPTPDGCKPLYVGPLTAMYVSEDSVEEATTAVRELLEREGWSPYGEAGDSYYFKRNVVKLSARVSAAPAQDNKTVIDYSSILLPVDIPLMPESHGAQFSDSPTQLFFDVDSSYDEISQFYREALGKLGWQATTDKLVQIDRQDMLFFRNPQGDLLEAKFNTVDDDSRMLIRLQTAAELADLKKRVAAEQARKKAEREKPQTEQTIKLPSNATDIENSEHRIEFSVGIGKAKAAVVALKKQLLADGWALADAEDEELEPMFGNLSLEKAGASLSLEYIESGVLAPEITITATGVALQLGTK